MEIYVIYAYAVLPIIVPLGFLLIEPSRAHRRWVAPFAVLGSVVGGYLSNRLYLRWFGVANLLGIALTLGIREADFTLTWCVYAALVSFLLLEHFRREGRLGSQPRSGMAQAAGFP
jgi:hypothetical protein